jgi:hypothetical protein
MTLGQSQTYEVEIGPLGGTLQEFSKGNTLGWSGRLLSSSVGAVKPKSLTILMGETGIFQGKPVIYSNGGARICEGAIQNLSVNRAQYYEIPFTTQPTLDVGGYYYICVYIAGVNIYHRGGPNYYAQGTQFSSTPSGIVWEKGAPSLYWNSGDQSILYSHTGELPVILNLTT